MFTSAVRLRKPLHRLNTQHYILPRLLQPEEILCMPKMLFYVRGGGGCISPVFIKSPIGIKSITLQHDRADEIVFSSYTKANLITSNIVWKTCECV